MREAAWMAGAAIGSWLAVAAVGGDRVNPESFFGMAGPLAAVCASWLALKEAHHAAPEPEQQLYARGPNSSGFLMWLE